MILPTSAAVSVVFDISIFGLRIGPSASAHAHGTAIATALATIKPTQRGAREFTIGF
jgi:hypothetical protein